MVEALPGETVYKKWIFKNTGNASWPHEDNLRFCLTNQSGDRKYVAHQELIVDKEIVPGEVIPVEIPIFAPEEQGLYYLTFTFVYGAHLQKWFSTQVTVILKVFIPEFPATVVEKSKN